MSRIKTEAQPVWLAAIRWALSGLQIGILGTALFIELNGGSLPAVMKGFWWRWAVTCWPLLPLGAIELIYRVGRYRQVSREIAATVGA